MGRWSVSESREAHHGVWTFRRVVRPISRLEQNHREIAACECAPSRRLSEATNFSPGFRVFTVGQPWRPFRDATPGLVTTLGTPGLLMASCCLAGVYPQRGSCGSAAAHTVRCFAFNVALVAFLIPALLSNERGFYTLRRAYLLSNVDCFLSSVWHGSWRPVSRWVTAQPSLQPCRASRLLLFGVHSAGRHPCGV